MKLVKLCLSAALLLSINSIAADYEYEIIPKIGQNFHDEDAGLDDEFLYGIDLNYYFTREAGLQVGYQRSDDVKYKWHALQTTDIQQVYLNLLYEPTKNNGLTPFLLIGGGYEKLSNEIGDKTSQAFANVGAGVRYALDRDFDISAEIKYVKKLDTMDDDLITNIGLGYKWGMPLSSSTGVQNTIMNTPQTKVSSFKPEPIPVPEDLLSDEISFGDLPLPEESGNKKAKDIFEQKEAAMAKSSSSKPTPAPQKSVTTNGNGYYIQIGAYAKNLPNQEYLNSIAQSGYQPILKEASVRGKKVTKILIGPYSSYEEAKNKLPEIKNKITNTAFIYKI